MTWKDLEKNFEKHGKGPEKSCKDLERLGQKLRKDLERLGKRLGKTWIKTWK